jgi:hypothetical protein
VKTTRFINNLWGDYYDIDFPEDSKEGDESDGPMKIEEEQENEDDKV